MSWLKSADCEHVFVFEGEFVSEVKTIKSQIVGYAGSSPTVDNIASAKTSLVYICSRCRVARIHEVAGKRVDK